MWYDDDDDDLDSGEVLTECECCGLPGSQDHAPEYEDTAAWHQLLVAGLHAISCSWWLSRGR